MRIACGDARPRLRQRYTLVRYTARTCRKARMSQSLGHLVPPRHPELLSPAGGPEPFAAALAAGADAISVLTEPKWFLGKDAYLKEIAGSVKTPCLRKDFTVDEYMIYEAKVLGAAAVLLICSILTEGQLKEFLGLCHELELSALVEIHDEAEAAMALRAGATIVGVNNRNLKDFSIDQGNCLRLKDKIPREVLFIAESGVTCTEDVKALERIGADGVLVGETLMRAADKGAKLKELRGGL